MAITGNENPEIEKEITPQSEAKLSPRRNVGKVPIITTPQACDARTRSKDAKIIGKIPLLQGKCNYP